MTPEKFGAAFFGETRERMCLW